MSDRNIVDYNGLATYDNKIKEYMTRNLENNYSQIGHDHPLSEIRFGPEKDTIARDSVVRLAGFRNCKKLFPNTAGRNRVTIETDQYDMAYVNVGDDVTELIIKLDVDSGVNINSSETGYNNTVVKAQSKARGIKIILVNAGGKTITWEDNVIWQDGVVDYTAKDTVNSIDGIDIVDLVTTGPDDSTTPVTPATWFANITNNYH